MIVVSKRCIMRNIRNNEKHRLALRIIIQSFNFIKDTFTLNPKTNSSYAYCDLMLINNNILILSCLVLFYE